MSFSTLMVHLELEHSNDARLRIAGDLAEQFDATLIGIAACDPQPTFYANGDFAQSLVSQTAPKSRSEWRKRKSVFGQPCSSARAISNGAPRWHHRPIS